MTREALAGIWRRRLDDYKESGGTVHEWCRLNRVSEHQYYYWKRRLAATPPQPVDQTWMAVNVVDPTPVPFTSGGVTVRIAGAAIELTPGFDPAMLRAVVTALAVIPC
jgi:hypothetical protein